MKKRLRKKLHKGEFQELGFELNVRFKASVSEKEVDNIGFSFLDLLEDNELVMGGIWDTEHLGCFITKHKSSVSLEQQNLIRDWLLKQPGIESINIGELKDAWY